jgi:hypothetical protein
MITTTAPTRNDGVRPIPSEMKGPSRLLQRMWGEFAEMPGLALTLSQAARLWSVTTPEAKGALTELIDGGFLMRDPRGWYRRRGV